MGQVGQGLEPDGQTDGPRADARGGELLVVQLTVGRARGMDDEALRVANVREMAPQVERGNEALPRLTPTLEIEHEDRPRALRQVPLHEIAIRARREARVAHARDRRVTLEELRDADRVLDVLGHPQRQRLEPEEEEERVER